LGDGGGIYVSIIEGMPRIEGNQFRDNLAADHGAGIHAADNLNASGIVVVENLFVRNRAGGLGGGDTGSGGAVWLIRFSGRIQNNTLVGNFGDGETPCSGGGFALKDTPASLLVRDNIIAFNEGCGIACKGTVLTDLGPNLLWGNIEGDLGNGAGECPAQWFSTVTIADPYFCDASNDDYTLAENSPALGMGALPTPGCGPVDVQRTTWGQIKAKY
jgi:hypothetical protein